MATKTCSKSEIHVDAEKCPYCQSDVSSPNIFGWFILLAIIWNLIGYFGGVH